MDELIKRFDEENRAKGLKETTRRNHRRVLDLFRRFINKPLDQATKQDIINFLNKKRDKKTNNGKAKELRPGTRVYRSSILKKFYKWAGKPKLVDWLKTTPIQNDISFESLLTQEEILKLVNAATNPRDRAIVMLLAESGCRVGELIDLKIKDMSFEENYGLVSLNGKTGKREIVIIDSIPHLRLYLNHHPDKENPEAPLFIGFKRKTALRWTGVYQLLMRLRKKTGIKKKCNPHNFRHTRITELGKQGFGDSEIKALAGWKRDSTMLRRYIHLTSKEVNQKILRRRGLLDKKEMAKENKLEPKKCPRCGEVNSVTAKFCEKCAQALTMKSAMELYRIKKEQTTGLLALNRILAELLKMPMVQRALRKRSDELGIEIEDGVLKVKIPETPVKIRYKVNGETVSENNPRQNSLFI